MELEPKTVTKEDVKQSLIESYEFIRSNFVIYFILWFIMMFNVYLTIVESYWLIIAPLFFAIGYVSMFELTCTLFVGYPGNLYKKLEISIKAGFKTLLVLIFNHPFIVAFYLLIFYSITFRAALGIIEDSSNFLWGFNASSWVGIMLTGFYNIFTTVRLGCISMFMKSFNDYSIVKILFNKAKQKNFSIYVYTSTIGLVMVMVMALLQQFFATTILSYFIITSFFLFQKIFEPPKLKKIQEKTIEIPNVIPDLGKV